MEIHCHPEPMWLWKDYFLCLRRQQQLAGGVMFSGMPFVRPSVRPVTRISREAAISLYLVEGFQRNLVQILAM